MYRTISTQPIEANGAAFRVTRQMIVEAVTESGRLRQLPSPVLLEPDHWYHVGFEGQDRVPVIRYLDAGGDPGLFGLRQSAAPCREIIDMTVRALP